MLELGTRGFLVMIRIDSGRVFRAGMTSLTYSSWEDMIGFHIVKEITFEIFTNWRICLAVM